MPQQPPLPDSPATQQYIRVVVADDHPVVRDGVVFQLNRHPDIAVVGTASTGAQALDLAQRLQPEVLVLDIRMPGVNPVDLVQRVRALPHAPAVLMFTAYDDVEQAVQLLNAGAGGYLLKDEPPATVAAAVRAVAEGQRWISAAMEVRLVEQSLARRATSQADTLSLREREVLRLLAEGNNNQQIADRLGISERTVRFHLRNIYDKLGVQQRGEAMAWAILHRSGRDN